MTEDLDPQHEETEETQLFSKRAGDRGATWLAKPASNLSVSILFASLCVLFGLIALSFTHLSNQQKSYQKGTCQIQARGLPAGHQLASSLTDIHKLITLKPETRAQKLAAQNEPKSVRDTVADLAYHLDKYQKTEAQQPKTRKC